MRRSWVRLPSSPPRKPDLIGLAAGAAPRAAWMSGFQACTCTGGSPAPERGQVHGRGPIVAGERPDLRRPHPDVRARCSGRRRRPHAATAFRKEARRGKSDVVDLVSCTVRRGSITTARSHPACESCGGLRLPDVARWDKTHLRRGPARQVRTALGRRRPRPTAERPDRMRPARVAVGDPFARARRRTEEERLRHRSAS